tara:strand:+ start:182 stop:988 length:807 start_codon:yes stop_codon:yes gene_type:complete
MAEITPQQILRKIIFGKNKGSLQFEKDPLQSRQVEFEKDPKLVALEDEIFLKNRENLRTFDPDPTFRPLEKYQSDSAGKQIADEFGMRVPGVSLFSNAAKAYAHGIAMNKHRDLIKNYVKEKMVKEGYTVDSYGNLNTEEARRELKRRMPEIKDPNAFREFSEGALAAIPLARPVTRTLGALYKLLAEETPAATSTDFLQMYSDETRPEIATNYITDDTGQRKEIKIIEKEKGDNKNILELAKSIGKIYMDNTNKTERPFVNEENVFK